MQTDAGRGDGDEHHGRESLHGDPTTGAHPTPASTPLRAPLSAVPDRRHGRERHHRARRSVVVGGTASDRLAPRERGTSGRHQHSLIGKSASPGVFLPGRSIQTCIASGKWEVEGRRGAQALERQPVGSDAMEFAAKITDSGRTPAHRLPCQRASHLARVGRHALPAFGRECPCLSRLTSNATALIARTGRWRTRIIHLVENLA